MVASKFFFFFLTYCVILSSYHPDWARPGRTHTQREPPADGATSNNNNRLLATIEAAAKKRRERGGIYIYICTRPLEHFETLSGVGKKSKKKEKKTNEIKTRKKKVIT